MEILTIKPCEYSFRQRMAIMRSGHFFVHAIMACLACGGVAGIRERRVLGVSRSEKVTVLWKETILKVLEREGKQLDIDNLISQDQGFMCRKCFYGYNKLIEKKEVHNYVDKIFF